MMNKINIDTFILYYFIIVLMKVDSNSGFISIIYFIQYLHIICKEPSDSPLILQVRFSRQL